MRKITVTCCASDNRKKADKRSGQKKPRTGDYTYLAADDADCNSM